MVDCAKLRELRRGRVFHDYARPVAVAPAISDDERPDVGPTAAPSIAAPAFADDLDRDLITDAAAVAPVAEDEALPLAFRGRVGFLTGPAGSGKTFLAKQLAADRPGWRMTASTWIAAVNLGGDATTINSLLGYFDEASLLSRLTNGIPQAILRKRRASGLTRIVLDEVSMVSGETLRLITHVHDEINEDISTQQGRTPFVDITVIGDFLQLAPVEERGAAARVGYAFESNTWPRYAERTTRLDRIWRQADPAFIEGLRAARRGDVDAVVAYFGPRCQPILDDAFAGITILATNKDVDTWNWIHHDRIRKPAVVFPVVRKGEQKSEWTKHLGACGKPNAPDVLALRPGARVMVLANSFEDGQLVYSNGDLGTFLEATKTGDALVKLERYDDPMVVERITREKEEATGAKGTRKEAYQIVGSINYVPLRLAFASTVHKSQGLTMDAVQVHIANRFFAQPSLLYVALSRARSVEGLRLVGTPALLRERCAVDPRVQEYL